VRGKGKGEITMETVNKIIEIFNSQSVAAVAAGDYEPVKPEIEIDKSDGSINVSIKSAKVIFAFDANGVFQGIVNWQ